LGKIEALQGALRRFTQQQLFDRTDAEINFQGLIDFKASRLLLPFSYANFKGGFDKGCHGEVMLDRADWKGHNEPTQQVMNLILIHESFAGSPLRTSLITMS